MKEEIEKELAMAREAQSSGNHGMARVCARRAAGAAIAHWLRSHPREDWGRDAMNLLRHLQSDEGLSDAVRGAATRLTSKITEQFSSPHSSDPVEDSIIIIDHLLGSGNQRY